MNPVSTYVNNLRDIYGSGQATEHSYRSPLASLLRAFDRNVQVINEPRRLEFGAPDLVLQLAGQPVGYVECKDVGIALDAVENSDQLVRYRKACDNLLLTNYREFRWYRGGDISRQPVSIARLTPDGLQAQRKNYGHLSSLLERFRRTSPADITSPEDLARVMADLTREIADLISETLNTPNLRSFLHQHKHDLEVELLPELDNDEFADMYAQTLAYALFAARMELQHLPAREFTLARAFTDMPRTNRFLHREFGQIFQELEREVKWAVEQLTTRLANTQISEVMRDFRSGTRQRDAIVHFYEDFLATHDPVLREQRGVYFTPEPVVGYIVRSVDSLLRSHFGRRDGLASSDVHILDPATGTGSFLLAVVEQIYETMRGQRGIWPDYVRRQLLPRLHGFELLMAPYTLAHMRMGLYLGEKGCPLGEDDRLNILLTNSLDEGEGKEGERRQELIWEDHIQAEARVAAEVKNDKPIMVVLGNPPYSGHSANKGGWIRKLLRDYYQVDGAPLGERNPKLLQDDYVKFLRFGQWRIGRNGEGVLAFITNHGWLDNPTFRGMRQSLLNSFSEIYVLDLHGNSRRKEVTPEGNRDDNVFDIQQGVSIAFFIKQRGHRGPARVYHADLWGLRREKYAALNAADVSDTGWQEIAPQSPSYLFRPFDYEGWREYERGWKVTDIFPRHATGIKTHRDHFVLDFDEEELRRRIDDFCNPDVSDEDIRHRYNLRDNREWKLRDSREALRKVPDRQTFIQPCLYRPFDLRKLFYHDSVVDWPRRSLMQNMFSGAELTGSSIRGKALQQTLVGQPGTTWDNLGQPGTTWDNLGQPGTTASRSSLPASSHGMDPGHSAELPTPSLSAAESPTRHEKQPMSSPSGSQVPDELEHMSGGGLGIITVRQVAEGSFNHVLASDAPIETRVTFSSRGAAFLFPLWLCR